MTTEGAIEASQSTIEWLLRSYKGSATYVLVTYIVRTLSGTTYVGRTSGLVRPGQSPRQAAREAIQARWDRHYDHLHDNTPANYRPFLDRLITGTISATPTLEEANRLFLNYLTIRGREDQMISVYRARSENPRHEVGIRNSLLYISHSLALAKFGIPRRRH